MSIEAHPNFYYYGNHLNQALPNQGLPRRLLPPGPKITTLLPNNVVLIRIAVTLFFTAFTAVNLGPTVWSWYVVMLGTSFAIFTAFNHFFTFEDPLVETFYKIAGSETGSMKQFYQLPVIHLDPTKKTFQNFSGFSWDKWPERSYRAVTSDGRKILIVKGKPEEKTQHTMVFVENLGSHDVPCGNEMIESAWAALYFWKNIFSRDLTPHLVQKNGSDVKNVCGIYAEISREMANQFIRQDTN